MNAPLTFTHTPETLTEWLHNRSEEIKAREYGEAESCILIVDTDERLRVFSFGPDSDNKTLRLVDRARAIIRGKWIGMMRG